MQLNKADVEFYYAGRVRQQALLNAGCDAAAWEKLSFKKRQMYLDQAVEMVQKQLIDE